MAILKDIEVRIARNTSGKVIAEVAGDALREYERPTATINESSDSVERYIEAVTGQTFQIEVYLTPSFKFYAAGGITVGLEIDDKTVYVSKYYSTEQVRQLICKGKPLVVSSVLRVEGNRQFRMGFTFGSLDLDEKLDVSQDQADSQAAKLGRIIVDIGRVTLGKEVPRNVDSFHNSIASVNVPKDVYKDRHIRHSIMAGPEVERKALSPTILERIPYRKHNCDKLMFIFRYRDHLGLQVLGCISKEASQASGGEAPTAIQCDRSDLVIEEDRTVNDEVVKLRAEIERLRAFEYRTKELETTVVALAQENTSMKATRDQVAALMGSPGSFSFVSPPSTLGIDTSVKRERIKEEAGGGRSSPSSASKERRAKRPRTFVEID